MAGDGNNSKRSVRQQNTRVVPRLASLSAYKLPFGGNKPLLSADLYDLFSKVFALQQPKECFRHAFDPFKHIFFETDVPGSFNSRDVAGPHSACATSRIPEIRGYWHV